MARRGKPAPKTTPKKRAATKPRRERRHHDAVAVWVTYQLVGASAAAVVHDCARRTVYRCVDDVENDPAVLATARARLEAQRAATEDRTAQLMDAAREALHARIKAGKVPTRWLVALVAPAGGKPSQGAHGLEVPSFITAPHVDAAPVEGES